MDKFTIHPHTHMGEVALTVGDLERSLAFYQERLGFQIHDRSSSTAHIGAGGADLLVLNEVRGARYFPGHSGLYHYAILLPSRLDLARWLAHMARTRTPLQGFSDHYVSEAIYLADPDGNGIEFYRDRPRDAWTFNADTLNMGVVPLDVDNLLSELDGDTLGWQGLPPKTIMGHVHLHVAHIPQTEAFYRDLLGFDVMVRLPSATFISAGGYHHHLGANTWAGVGAPPRPADSVGLNYYTIYLPSEDARQQVVERVNAAGIASETRDGDVLLHDPAQNALLLKVD